VSYRDEVVSLLQELLRLDTVNPPGNETQAAQLLRNYLGRNGLEATLVGRTPERANVVARLPGGDGPTLALIAHTDTVIADAGEWQRDPWSGDVVDEEVWGRGALDMKGHVAAAAVAVASLAREGVTPAGDVVLALTADEEVGLDFGLSWLVREHPDLVRSDLALNEGGGERVELGGRVFYLCSVGEKRTSAFRVRVHGRSGHASVPSIADNALLKAARYLQALERVQAPRELLPPVRRFLQEVLGDVPPLDEALDRARRLHPLAAELVEPLLSVTLSPTMIEASRQRNVIPATCTITVDCRLLPGQTHETLEPLLRAALGEGSWELEWIWEDHAGGSMSETDTPLWTALERWVDRIEPGAHLVPILGAGFTDSHYLRSAFGTVAYGFFPLREMSLELASRLVHSADERIAIADVELAVDAFRHAALGTGSDPSGPSE
jgi:acetylornithine deacetylase/succinyl-diaminopimelate desuccinylase-like protein